MNYKGKFCDEFIISDMANDYTKYIAILSVILQIVKFSYNLGFCSVGKIAYIKHD